MTEIELNEEEKAELNARLNDNYNRLQKLYKAYYDTMTNTQKLLHDLRENDCKGVAMLIEQMQLNTLLQINLAQQLILDKQDELRPQGVEPLQCRFCDKKSFWK